MAIKTELHQLIDNCQNELLLTQAKELLQSGDTEDWWDELSKEDQLLVMESEAQYDKGNFITHNALMQQFEAWKKK